MFSVFASVVHHGEAEGTPTIATKQTNKKKQKQPELGSPPSIERE